VLCVPSLLKKLLSIGMIADKGNTMVFDSNKCLVINNGDPNIIVAKGVKDQKNGLYRLQVHFVQCSTSQHVEACVGEGVQIEMHVKLCLRIKGWCTCTTNLFTI